VSLGGDVVDVFEDFIKCVRGMDIVIMLNGLRYNDGILV